MQGRYSIHGFYGYPSYEPWLLSWMSKMTGLSSMIWTLTIAGLPFLKQLAPENGWLEYNTYLLDFYLFRCYVSFWEDTRWWFKKDVFF